MNLLLVVILLQFVLLAAIVVLLFRRSSAQPSDPRIAGLASQLARLDARSESLDAALRNGLGEIRREANDSARVAREAAARDFIALRTEITASIATLGNALNIGLTHFRTDNKSSAEALSSNVRHQLESITQALRGFIADLNQNQIAARENLNARLADLGTANTGNLEKIRSTVEDRLNKLNADNSQKLDQMRQTVDEKLQATLQTRLTESFGQVTTHLGEVQKGLGEMKILATDFGDLKKVFSNVSRRGGVGEFLVGQQLEQMFSPEQYLKQVNIKSNTGEKVDFALKFPNGDPGSFILLPIDAKFPTSDWERLEHAYEHGTAEEIADAGKAFERAIRTQAKSICEKYIDPPSTMPHAIMVLPTEGLYAEVARRPGLQSEVQSNCRVTIAGPSTFMAILTSFQMGFHTLEIQKKGDDVWRVLSEAKTEFDKFGGLMDKVRKQVDTVQNTLGDIGGKTKTINRKLRNVTGEIPVVPVPLTFDEVAGFAPLLAASIDED